jgi:hypothetical protein
MEAGGLASHELHRKCGALAERPTTSPSPAWLRSRVGIGPTGHGGFGLQVALDLRMQPRTSMKLRATWHRPRCLQSDAMVRDYERMTKWAATSSIASAGMSPVPMPCVSVSESSTSPLGNGSRTTSPMAAHLDAPTSPRKFTDTAGWVNGYQNSAPDSRSGCISRDKRRSACRAGTSGPRRCSTCAKRAGEAGTLNGFISAVSRTQPHRAYRRTYEAERGAFESGAVLGPTSYGCDSLP